MYPFRERRSGDWRNGTKHPGEGMRENDDEAVRTRAAKSRVIEEDNTPRPGRVTGASGRKLALVDHRQENDDHQQDRSCNGKTDEGWKIMNALEGIITERKRSDEAKEGQD